MEKCPLVSVIIPCYNSEVFIRDSINSIINQTYQNLEIICVNDGSNDHTGKILEELALQDKRIRVMHNATNLKLIGTLNLAIETSTGEYIARMDADDISLPERIEQQLKCFLDNSNVDVVSIQPGHIANNGKKLGRVTDYKATGMGACRFVSLFNPPVCHPSIMIKASLLKKYKYRSESFTLHTEDYDLWVRLILDNRQFVSLDKQLFLYRINQNGTGLSNRGEQTYNHRKISQFMIYSTLKEEIDLELLGVINRHYNAKNNSVLIAVLKTFNRLRLKYVENYGAELTQLDIKEIEEWYYQRIIFIIFRTIKSSNLRTKLFALYLVARYIKMVIYPSTYTNLIYRTRLMLLN